MCTKNEDHMIYGSWDIRHDGQGFLSFWAIFCHLILLTTRKLKILKKWKTSLEVLSFYSSSTTTIIWCMFPEIWSTTDRIFGHFGPFFPFFPTNKLKNQNFEKTKKILRDIIFLHVSTINENLITYGSWDMECDRQNFFSHFGPSFTLLPLYQSRKSKFWKKWKKRPWDIIILHRFTINDNHMMNGSWEMKCDRHIFVSFWEICLPFYPTKNSKNQNFKKLKEMLGDNILHMCTTNYDHMMYGSWDMERDRHNFSHIGLFFVLLPV